MRMLAKVWKCSDACKHMMLNWIRSTSVGWWWWWQCCSRRRHHRHRRRIIVHTFRSNQRVCVESCAREKGRAKRFGCLSMCKKDHWILEFISIPSGCSMNCHDFSIALSVSTQLWVKPTYVRTHIDTCRNRHRYRSVWAHAKSNVKK